MADIKVRSVTDTVDRWSKNAKQNRTWYEKGVKDPRQNPMEAALRHGDDWQSRVSSTEAFEKWKASVGGTSMSEWQDAAITLGVPRFSKGIDFGRDKYEKFYNKFKPKLETVVSKVNGMSGRTLEDRIDRSVTLQRELAEFSYRR